jgi:hypothetical protein
MTEYLKIPVLMFIGLLLIACAKRQRRYWREMTNNRPTGSLKAGYLLAIVTIFVALAIAAVINSPVGWEVFLGILLMTLVFCVKITFSPSVVALVLIACAYQFYVYDRLPIFEILGGAVSVLAWRLPEQFRVIYTTISFAWVLVVFLGGGNPEIGSADDIANVSDELM